MTAILLAAMAATPLLLGLRTRFYRRWCALAPVREDATPFTETGNPRSITSPEFDLPAKPDGTALLRIQVRSTWRSRWIDPHIELATDNARWRLDLERGATGVRLLDISPVLRAEANSRLRIRGRGVELGAAELLTFYAPPVPSNVLVLAPHPDDAEIAAFGLYSTCSPTAWVVTVTAGDSPGANRRGLIARRVSESLTTPARAGVSPDRCVNLAFPDGALAPMARSPAVARRLSCEEFLPRARLRAMNARASFRESSPDCTWDELVAALARLIELARPEIVVTPHPLLDVHPDHVATTRALLQALASTTAQPSLLLYAVHIRGCAAYPLGRAGSPFALSPATEVRALADAPFSFPLSAEMQAAKRAVLGGLAMIGGAKMRLADRLVARLAGVAEPASFVRRAVRAQEFFYRLDAARLVAMIEALDDAERS